MSPDEFRRSATESDDQYPATEGGADDDFYDDEDFYTAIDLLETSRNCMKSALKYGTLNQARRHIMISLCDDIGNFLADFITEDSSNPPSVGRKEVSS